MIILIFLRGPEFLNVHHFMPPKRVPAKKQSELLEEETKKMENIMAMLRGQIEEERAKVQSTKGGTRWAAAAEGPIGKFDSHGALARQILSKKTAKKTSENSPSSRSKSEKASENAPVSPPPATSSSSLDASRAKRTKGNVEVVVEPQGGKLWGPYMDDEALKLQQQQGGGALWGNKKSDSGAQPDEAPRGGSLWGPPPDESAERLKFQEEVAKFRGQGKTSTSSCDDDPNLPPIGAGGALWGPPPNEFEEQMKFQREVARLRGNTQLPEPIKPTESEGTGANLVQKKNMDPSGFTYFDRLVTKNILDGTPVIQTNPPPKDKK